MDATMDDVFFLYEQKVAPLSSADKEKLLAARDEGMSPFVIGCAILRAKQEQRRSRLKGKEKHISFNYIYRIIEDWLNHGITTEERFRAYWPALTEDQDKNGGDKGYGAQAKIRKEDFTYTPTKQDRSLFSFLDE